MLSHALKSLLPTLLLLGSASAFRAPLQPFSRAVLSTVTSSSTGFATRLYSTTEGETEKKEEEESKRNVAGHDVRSSGTPMEIDPEELKIQQAFAEHQQNAPKLGYPVDGTLSYDEQSMKINSVTLSSVFSLTSVLFGTCNVTFV